MAKVNRVGERNLANNGQWMEIVEWFNNKNITVKFEDGTVVKNRAYGCFKKGEIANPNYRKRPSRLINRIGEKRKANNGQWMEIIEYFEYKNITIKFEDETIVTNKDYRKFKSGKIRNPNYKKCQLKDTSINAVINKVGETNIAKNGQMMKIIAYHSATNIDICFEDGTIVFNKRYSCFKSGYIMNPNYRIGETNIATNGQKMKIIIYRNASDIDIQFEDGTIVTNKTYSRFKKGRIANPNYKCKQEPYIGEECVANNGQMMIIIACRNVYDIDIKFEDSTIVYHKRYSAFRKGQIANPNYNPYSRIGEKRKANNGQWMEIIEYFEYKNITVKFEDGTIVYNKSYGEFKKGAIRNLNYKRIQHANNFIDRTGKTNIATNGQKMTIIAYRGCCDIDVQFEDGTIVYNKSYSLFKKGSIENPNYKVSSGISINEFVIYYYLRKYGFIKKEKGSLKDLGFGKMELDCYHPDYKIAIEYDGNLHATRQNNDKRKNKACKQNGITIIRIREPKCPVLNDNSIEYQLNSNERFSISFEKALKEVFEYINSITELNIDENISFEHDRNIILKKFNRMYVNKDINSRLGETVVALNGQKMTIIAYRGCSDIDIQFEDGTIVYNKHYGNFKKGVIKNPNYNSQNLTSRIGKTNLATNGQKMTIIVYRRNGDIDIQFEDGTIVYHKCYENFIKGKIANPNYNPYSRTGEKNKANNGQWMKIIGWRKYTDIDVQFEDGTIVYHKNYGCFKKGQMVNPNFKKVA